VASGHPTERAVTLWSRVDGVERSGRLDLEIARDPGFSDIVHTQRVRAASVRDYVVRTRVGEGLRPGEQYFYRFATRGADSPIGRFVTARPRGSREPDIHTFLRRAGHHHRAYPRKAGGDGVRRRLDHLAGHPRDPRVPAWRAGDERHAAHRAPGTQNPHIKSNNQAFRGYGVLECRPDELLCTFRGPASTMVDQSPTMTLARFRVPRDQLDVEVMQGNPNPLGVLVTSP
jgi:hypothetical protein